MYNCLKNQSKRDWKLCNIAGKILFLTRLLGSGSYSRTYVFCNAKCHVRIIINLTFKQASYKSCISCNRHSFGLGKPHTVSSFYGMKTPQHSRNFFPYEKKDSYLFQRKTFLALLQQYSIIYFKPHWLYRQKKSLRLSFQCVERLTLRHKKTKHVSTQSWSYNYLEVIGFCTITRHEKRVVKRWLKSCHQN